MFEELFEEIGDNWFEESCYVAGDIGRNEKVISERQCRFLLNRIDHLERTLNEYVSSVERLAADNADLRKELEEYVSASLRLAIERAEFRQENERLSKLTKLRACNEQGNQV